MIRTWHFYDLATGLFSGAYFSASDERHVAINIPQGCGAREGVTHPQAQCIDLATGEISDYQPPSPGADHEWDGEMRRWVLSAEGCERRRKRVAARERIQQLESNAQPRAIREVALRYEGAEERLAAIDAEIAALRPLLTD